MKLKPAKDGVNTICSTMGCRTYNGYDINWHDSWKKALEEVAETGQLDEKVLNSPRAKAGRGNISPVTVILPTLAMKCKIELGKKLDKAKLEEALLKHLPQDTIYGEKEIRQAVEFKTTVYADAMDKALNDLLDKEELVDAFFKLYEKKLEEARQTLFDRFEWQCSQSEKSAKFMYENGTMYGYIPEEGIRSALKHGTTVIGQIGLAETLNILIGKDQTTEEGMELAKRLEKFVNAKCKEFKQKYKMNVGNYFTPAENLCFTAMKKFKETYGVLDNISDKEFFTNSMHVPVWDKLDPFEKIDTEAELTGLSNAGCITYTEIDADAQKNIEALEKLVLHAMEKDIPYFRT